MRKQLLILGISILSFATAMAQNVGINTTGAAPNASAMLDISDTKTGLLIPRVDIAVLTTATPVTSPATSLLVYNTNVTTGPGYFYWDGSKWVKLFDINDGKPWLLTGNAGTTVGTNFLGTTDNVSLSFKTNNTERMRILNSGNVGIGTSGPAYKLDVSGYVRASGEIISTSANSFRDVTGNYGLIFRNDGSNFYLLSTASGNQYGGWNGLRPFRIGMASGDVFLANGTSIFRHSDGFVGIGTTAPSQRLHVSGNLRVTGAYYDSNNSSGSSGQVLSSTVSGTRWTKGQTIQSNSASVTAGNWYRIASNPGNRADASFTLRDFISGGGHSTLRFHAGVNFGYAPGISFNLVSHSIYSTATFTKVRIIENGTYDGAYLEVYCNRSGSVEYDMYDNFQSAGWTPVDWTPGSVPGGWTAHEYETDRVFAVGSSNDLLSLTRGGNLGIGTASPANLLSVGASSQFQVGTTGDLDRVNNVPYNWPSANAGGTLLNDGSGNLSWAGASWEKVVDVSINSTSYTASGLDGNNDVAYRIVLMGRQVSSAQSYSWISVNGDSNTNNYTWGMDGWWWYDGSKAWNYDPYNVGGIFLWSTYGGYDPNYIESETLLSSFTGNWRHGVTRYSLAANTKNIAVNLSAGVWKNTTTNITSLVFNWTSTFTGRLIIYALH